MSFSDKFASYGREVQRKAPILRILIIVCIVALPLISITEFLANDVVNGIVELFVSLLFLVFLLLLNRGKYRFASSAVSITAFIVLAFVSFMSPEPSKYLIYRNAVYFITANSLAFLFVHNRRLPLVIAIAGGAGIVVFVFAFLMPAGVPVADFLNQLIISLFFYTLINYTLIKNMTLRDETNRELDGERQKDAAYMENLSTLVQGVSVNFEKLGLLNTRFEDIRARIGEANRAIEAIGSRIEDIEGSTRGSLSQTATIGDRVGELNHSIEEESAAQIESSASINEMVASIRSVADSATRRRKAMEALSGTTEDGMTRLATLMTSVQKIEGSIGSIQGMVAVINAIAGSTNLLSMNAAIEAAHAGDAGRGFAVVAEEIRKLADTSGKNAKEIGRQLKDVIQIIHDAVAESDSTRSSFESIRGEIASAIEAFNEITSATSELAEGGRQILEALQTLSELSHKVQDGGGEIVGARESLETLQNNTLGLLEKLRNEARLVAEKDQAVLVVVDEVSSIGQSAFEAARSLKEDTARARTL